MWVTHSEYSVGRGKGDFMLDLTGLQQGDQGQYQHVMLAVYTFDMMG